MTNFLYSIFVFFFNALILFLAKEAKRVELHFLFLFIGLAKMAASAVPLALTSLRAR